MIDVRWGAGQWRCSVRGDGGERSTRQRVGCKRHVRAPRVGRGRRQSGVCGQCSFASPLVLGSSYATSPAIHLRSLPFVRLGASLMCMSRALGSRLRSAASTLTSAPDHVIHGSTATSVADRADAAQLPQAPQGQSFSCSLAAEWATLKSPCAQSFSAGHARRRPGSRFLWALVCRSAFFLSPPPSPCLLVLPRLPSALPSVLLSHALLLPRPLLPVRSAPSSPAALALCARLRAPPRRRLCAASAQ